MLDAEAVLHVWWIGGDGLESLQAPLPVHIDSNVRQLSWQLNHGIAQRWPTCPPQLSHVDIRK